MEEEPQTAGQQANIRFVDRMRIEHPELAEQIPEECLGCSSAWQQAERGNIDIVAKCAGRSEIKVGELTVMSCQLEKPAKS